MEINLSKVFFTVFVFVISFGGGHRALAAFQIRHCLKRRLNLIEVVTNAPLGKLAEHVVQAAVILRFLSEYLTYGNVF